MLSYNSLAGDQRVGRKAEKKKQAEIHWEAVGQRMAEIRQIRNMKQSDLAEELDCTVTHYSDMERGKKHFSLNIVMLFAEATGGSMNYIMYGKGPRWLSEVEEQEPSEAEAEIVKEKEVPIQPSLDRMLKGLTPEHQAAARKCAVTVINTLKQSEKVKR